MAIKSPVSKRRYEIIKQIFQNKNRSDEFCEFLMLTHHIKVKVLRTVSTFRTDFFISITSFYIDNPLTDFVQIQNYCLELRTFSAKYYQNQPISDAAATFEGNQLLNYSTNLYYCNLTSFSVYANYS